MLQYPNLSQENKMSNMSLFEIGYKAYSKNHFKKAFTIFKQGAETGDIDCMTQLANMYTCGEGTRCDYDKAIEWEMRAIELGHTSAMLNVGITFRIKGDMKLARSWFEKALAAGDNEAALQLAKLYRVSDLETARVKEYLQITMNGVNVCESSIHEATMLLHEIAK
jgi:TPR repeat protein